MVGAGETLTPPSETCGTVVTVRKVVSVQVDVAGLTKVAVSVSAGDDGGVAGQVSLHEVELTLSGLVQVSLHVDVLVAASGAVQVSSHDAEVAVMDGRVSSQVVVSGS